MKKCLLFIISCFFCISLFSQTRVNSKYNKSFREAQNYFDSADYGKSLKKAEDSIMFKKQEIEREVSLLENSLISKDVKAAQDKITLIKPILRERQEFECIEIIDYYIGKYGESRFNNSLTQLISFIKTLKEFPEAQKLIGDIYKIEGEYSFAEEYYSKALKNSEILDIPDEKYEILYTMADLSRLMGNYNKMEERLLNISGKENLENRKMILNSALNMISRNNVSSVNRLFELYRYDDYYSLKAFCLLSDYYESIGQYEKALSFSALSVITGFTKLDSIISKRNLSYEYESLDAFLLEVANYSDLVEWGSNNNIWKSFNNLCNLSYKIGYKNFSNELLKVLAKNSPDEYYQRTAVLKLEELK